MNIETQLALEILSESKLSSHQRRHSAVVKFIDMYGIIPSFERIVEGLPKRDSIERNVLVPQAISEEINSYERLLKEEPGDQQIISKLDGLYDIDYRLTKK